MTDVVILAAGMGSRLESLTSNLPKCLLNLTKDETILDHNLNTILNLNVENIYIVTGFKGEIISKHINENYHSRKNIQIIYNPFWRNCNVLGSLYLTFGLLKNDFIFLHADTITSQKIWDKLLLYEGDVVLPFQKKICGLEEMKIKIENRRVIDISKDIPVSEAEGEFIGISKFSKKFIKVLINCTTELFQKGELGHYIEQVIKLNLMREDILVTYFDIANENFIEVDFYDDYIKAKKYFGKP